MSVTGFQLITGTEISPTGMFGGEMNTTMNLILIKKKKLNLNHLPFLLL
jgi:hypothetical protein